MNSSGASTYLCCFMVIVMFPDELTAPVKELSPGVVIVRLPVELIVAELLTTARVVRTNGLNSGHFENHVFTCGGSKPFEISTSMVFLQRSYNESHVVS